MQLIGTGAEMVRKSPALALRTFYAAIGAQLLQVHYSTSSSNCLSSCLSSWSAIQQAAATDVATPAMTVAGIDLLIWFVQIPMHSQTSSALPTVIRAGTARTFASTILTSKAHSPHSETIAWQSKFS
jgi:hypothetical protein